MYQGLGDPLVATGIAVSVDPIPVDFLPPELTQGPYIPPPNSGTASALLRASITANAPGASDVLSYGTLADKAALIPGWAWMAGGGLLLFSLFAGGRRR